MRIEKKRYIRRIKLKIRLRRTRYQLNAISAIGWTKFNRHIRLVLGLSKILFIKNNFIIKYFGFSTNLTKWNNLSVNYGSSTIFKPYNKSVKLDDPTFNLKSVNVITCWNSGRFLVNKKSGSKKFTEWSSKNFPNKKSQVRDMCYRESYTVLMPYFTEIKIIKSKFNTTIYNKIILDDNLHTDINNTINFL